MKKTTWLGILFGAAVLGYLVISSLQSQPFRCKVCISYRGDRNCATGAAQSEPQALRIAIQTACATIASGVIEANKCESTPPDSVEWLRRR